MKAGMPLEEIQALTHIDPWFLANLAEIVRIEEELRKVKSLEDASDDLIREAKRNGFSDHQLAHLWNTT